MMDVSVTWWVLFNLALVALLALDLGVFRRDAHEVGFREASVWSGIWVALALAFDAGLYARAGPGPALEFLAGYAIEKALAIDNIFVFALIFSSFRVPAAYQHRVLTWGILGALAMRAALIAAGVALIERFHWMTYAFGVLLVVTGVRMALVEGKGFDPERHPALRLVRRLVPLTDRYEGGRLFVRRGARLLATPLFVVLVMIEVSDLIFAVDSIPAILAVTRDPFLVYTSNALAILGLRSLYFALAGMMGRFGYLHYGLSAVLVLVGAKMLLADVFEVPVVVSLGAIAALIGGSVGLSLPATRPGGRADGPSAPGPQGREPGQPRAPAAVAAVPPE
jgi:tellurite resistance protein TerC